MSASIDADADGSGEVKVTARLDRQAVEAVGELDKQLKFDDLVTAGWQVEGVKVQDDGGAEIVVQHGFTSPAEAKRLVADVAGEHGPFKGFALEQRRTFFKTHTSFRGTVNLQDGLAAFSDPRLQEALGGQPLGVTQAELERRLGAPVNQVFGLQVAVGLPGKVESNAPTKTRGTAVWAPKLGEQVALDATAEQWNVRNVALLSVSLASWTALAAVVVVRRRSRVTVGNDGQAGADD